LDNLPASVRLAAISPSSLRLNVHRPLHHESAITRVPRISALWHQKAHPGELNYASLGTGTSGHLAT